MKRLLSAALLLSVALLPLNTSASAQSRRTPAVQVQVISQPAKPTPQPTSNTYFLQPGEYFYVADKNAPSYSVRVFRHDTHTEVEFKINVQWDWVVLNTDCLLFDGLTGDQYAFHSFKGDMPLNKSCVIRNEMGKTVAVTYIFPPLREGVKYVEFVSGQVNGIATSLGNVKVETIRDQQKIAYSKTPIKTPTKTVVKVSAKTPVKTNQIIKLEPGFSITIKK